MWPEFDTVGPTVAFGHTRYKTSWTHNSHNSQPFKIGDNDTQLEILFNGNIPWHELIRRDHMPGYTFQTLGDTETLARFVLHHIVETLRAPGQTEVRHAIRESVKRVIDTFPGGYSAIGKFQSESFVFKDRYGIRPTVLWKTWNKEIISSENHFFDSLWYETVGEIPHGSLYFPGTEPEYLLNEQYQMHPDVFEFVYLAKDGSRLYGVENTKVRYDLWLSAAQELRAAYPELRFTQICAVPNGANIMRKGALHVYGMPEDMPNGITRKPHSERSFMASLQDDREAIVRDKFILHPEYIVGEDILLIDDSIVRGTTMQVIVDMLLEQWARSVFVLPASPAVHYGDRYGIAMGTGELIGVDQVSTERLSTENIESKLFYDPLSGRQKARLFYPSIDSFLGVFKKHGLFQVHAAYFDGKFIAG